jgi:hypothetical protein
VNRLCGWLSRFIALLFRLYPSRYREQFEHEMHQVFRLAAQDVSRCSFWGVLGFYSRELSGAVGGLLSQHWQQLVHTRSKPMQTPGIRNSDGFQERVPQAGNSPSWTILLAGSTIFFIWGLEAILLELAFSTNRTELNATMMVSILILSWVLFLLPPAVVGFAWMRNFPRWTYPYVGAALVYAATMDGISSPEFPFSNGVYSPWGWRAWIPLIMAVGIALISTRSVRPLGRFFINAWDDWTLLSFAMFGMAPLFLLASFDELAPGYSLKFMPVVLIILVTTVMLYLAGRYLYQRAWVLFTGAFLSLGITMVVTEVYWMGVGGFDMRRLALIQAVFLGVMFSPGLIGAFRHFRQADTRRYA